MFISKSSFIRINGIFNRKYSTLSSLKDWVSSKIDPSPQKLNFGQMRISPIESSDLSKDHFIPLTRSTLIRNISQNKRLVKKESEFEDFCRYLDSCLANRLFFFFKELKTNYEHLNPDVEKSGEYKRSRVRSQILDDEFWFAQKFGHLLEMANFKELDRPELEKWLKRTGGVSSVQVWINESQYDLLKVWVLGRDGPKKSQKLINFDMKKYWPMKIFDNPYRTGNTYRRVALAIRRKGQDKVELKLFKDLSLGELIHTLPRVTISNSKLDNTILFWTGSSFVISMALHFLLTSTTYISSSWIFSTTDRLANALIALSVFVGIGDWSVCQKKNSNYWKWQSELNYSSIVANNRGVISLLSDRAHDEVLKEAILSYIHVLKYPSGISQVVLEEEIQRWVSDNCDIANYQIRSELNEAISILRQLNLVTVSSSTGQLTAKPMEHAVPILGTEFRLSQHYASPENYYTSLDHSANMADFDKKNEVVADRSDQPPAEAFEMEAKETKSSDKIG